MSDKTQHTAASLQERMTHRYGDGLHHKHNKNHILYRQHCKSHPNHQSVTTEAEPQLNESTGLIRKFKLRNMRKRLDKGGIH
ncbi:MAG: hypothetical protein ACHP65_03515 [Legionellales bacterium]